MLDNLVFWMNPSLEKSHDIIRQPNGNYLALKNTSLIQAGYIAHVWYQDHSCVRYT